MKMQPTTAISTEIVRNIVKPSLARNGPAPLGNASELANPYQLRRNSSAFLQKQKINAQIFGD